MLEVTLSVICDISKIVTLESVLQKLRMIKTSSFLAMCKNARHVGTCKASLPPVFLSKHFFSTPNLVSLYKSCGSLIYEFYLEGLLIPLIDAFVLPTRGEG